MQWEEDFLQLIFALIDIQGIKQIPLVQNSSDDLGAQLPTNTIT